MALTGIKSSMRYPKNILYVVFIPLYDLHLLVLNWINSSKINEHLFIYFFHDLQIHHKEDLSVRMTPNLDNFLPCYVTSKVVVAPTVKFCRGVFTPKATNAHRCNVASLKACPHLPLSTIVPTTTVAAL